MHSSCQSSCVRCSRVYQGLSYIPFALGRHFSYTPFNDKRLMLCTQLKAAKSEIPCSSDVSLSLYLVLSRFVVRRVWSAAKSSCTHWICCLQRIVRFSLANAALSVSPRRRWRRQAKARQEEATTKAAGKHGEVRAQMEGDEREMQAKRSGCAHGSLFMISHIFSSLAHSPV